MNALEVMSISPIVPVIALDRVEDAIPLAEALLQSGIRIMEITLRTDSGLASIERIATQVPQMHVGAGTVVDALSMKKAVEHGAEFVFSPGISEELMQSARQHKTTLIPGVATASEVMLALTNGFEHCKLFPATVAGGVDALKAFSGPFPTVHFCPTGGVNLANMNEFLALENVLCVGGSWIVPKEKIFQKEFTSIISLGREALLTVK
jgi:2-dehydro-3-deoxyphosphogluconate aldolase/(4S)-4-hydroxy-2-oxoglutarate aldolase